ncbi:MAG TPA: ABC transporter substrate-binding protein [Stellaceae bacterium]|nr:ABC transporter substrate-binding protein [Stellaceae bacterium]
MKRRDFMAMVGGAVAARPVAVRAQQAAMPVVGFLNSNSPPLFVRPVEAFQRGLAEAGYVDGKNVTIEYRWAESRNERLPAMAADLVQRQVSVIAATTTPAALAAKAATATIPIVFETGGDPVALGLVASLSRPGGNVTGVTQLTSLLAPKGLEILHELLPAAHHMALLLNPSTPRIAEDVARGVRAAARTLGLEFEELNASTEGELDGVFVAVSRSPGRGLVISPDPFFTSRNEHLAALAARHAVPAIYIRPEFAAAGGLVSYGNDLADSYRLAGLYTGRILKGEKPADLPVPQATKVELIVNLKAAAALGITIPPTLLARADEVIE